MLSGFKSLIRHNLVLKEANAEKETAGGTFATAKPFLGVTAIYLKAVTVAQTVQGIYRHCKA